MGLEALCPHQNLKELEVFCYRGVKPPSWLPSLANLVSISFWACRSIQWLPPLDQLPNLKALRVSDLTNLEYIDVFVNYENEGSSSFFPFLEAFNLRNCPNLKGFVRRKTDVGTKPSSSSSLSAGELPLPCFPCVSSFGIIGCPNLIYMPLFLELKLLHLTIDGVKSLNKMKMLQFSSSPFSTLSQLKYLSIIDMEEFLEDELLQYLTSLQHLMFLNCPCKSLSRDDKGGGMQWKSLKLLQIAEFILIENLVSLPKGLQYVTTLQFLEIEMCRSLVSIPEWMGSLIALQHLTIKDCPQLSERCKNNTAEDWPKISQIPNIRVEGLSIQWNG